MSFILSCAVKCKSPTSAPPTNDLTLPAFSSGKVSTFWLSVVLSPATTTTLALFFLLDTDIFFASSLDIPPGNSLMLPKIDSNEEVEDEVEKGVELQVDNSTNLDGLVGCSGERYVLYF